MANQESTPARTDALGVVDPIRIPGLDPARRAFARLPVLGRVFVLLAIVDVVGLLTGFLGIWFRVDLTLPAALLAAFVPHDLLILLPAIVLWRRNDAATATPLVLWGAVAIAVAEFAYAPLTQLPSNRGGGVTVESWTAIAALTTIARAGGWLTLSMGLAALNPPFQTTFANGLANLIALLIAGSGVVGLLLTLALPAGGIGSPEWDAMILLANSLPVLETIAIAVLARTIVRGLGDRRRPTAAIAIGAAGVGGHAAVAFLQLVAGSIALVQLVLAASAGALGGAVALGIVQTTVAPTLIVVAFALGLADSSVRIPQRDGAAGLSPEPEPAAVHWPATFEDDNVPYHPELVPPRAPEATLPPSKRGRKGKRT